MGFISSTDKGDTTEGEGGGEGDGEGVGKRFVTAGGQSNNPVARPVPVVG